MSSPLVRRCWALLAGAWFALAGVPAVAVRDEPPTGELPPPSKIRDLDYGDVLFHFFQDDYFESLVRLEVSHEFDRLSDHAAEAELLAGGLYLSLGLHGEATRRFESVLAGSVPQSVGDRAHFYLARIGFQRGYLEEAARSLGHIRGPLPGSLEPERRLLEANVMMAQGRYEQAARSLEAWAGGGDWAVYARFNLGVAMVRTGETARGRQLLESVGTMPVRNEEHRALRDRANLALGFALLQQRQPDPAAAALARVRLDGPFTNRALLGLGWAEADAARPERALVPWLELRERPVLEAAVQESLLAVPYAYAQLAANGQAAEQYRHAVSAFAAETARLDESIAAIRGGGFLDAVLGAAPDPDSNADDEDQAGWLWQLKQAPDAPHTRYLYQLFATHAFQEGLRNYRDLGLMRRNLERRAESLEAFHEMVAAREAETATRAPRKARIIAGTDLDSLEARRADLETRVAELVAAREVMALATAEEAAQWRKLEVLLARTAALPPGTPRDALAERVRLLRGTLAWQLDADYKLRLSRLRTSLAETDAALAEAGRRRALVEQAGDFAPRSTEGFAERVGGIERRVERLLPAIDAAAAAQQRLLADIAIGELEAQKARLASYATQAQFALAALYDGASAGGAR